jgi:hypothetical protein
MTRIAWNQRFAKISLEQQLATLEQMIINVDLPGRRGFSIMDMTVFGWRAEYRIWPDSRYSRQARAYYRILKPHWDISGVGNALYDIRRAKFQIFDPVAIECLGMNGNLRTATLDELPGE